jgi:hypothetical protein
LRTDLPVSHAPMPATAARYTNWVRMSWILLALNTLPVSSDALDQLNTGATKGTPSSDSAMSNAPSTTTTQSSCRVKTRLVRTGEMVDIRGRKEMN